MYRLAPVILVSLFVAGCAESNKELFTAGGTTGTPGTGSACTNMHSPEYAVKGATNTDQVWINKTTEAIVVGCNQPRPKPRPASFDAKPTPAAVSATTAEPTPEKQAAKRKKWFGF